MPEDTTRPARGELTRAGRASGWFLPRGFHFGQWALQPPLFLQSFLPAQSLAPSTLQPPLPLPSFWPLQQALAPAAAAAGSPLPPAGDLASGVPSPPQALSAPSM